MNYSKYSIGPGEVDPGRVLNYLSRFLSPMYGTDHTIIGCIGKASSRASLDSYILFVSRVKATRELLHTRLCTDEMYHAKLL